MKNTPPHDVKSPSQRITDLIAELADWRGKLLAQLRKLILDAAPEVSEDWKWGTAVWVQQGNVVAAGDSAVDVQSRPAAANGGRVLGPVLAFACPQGRYAPRRRAFLSTALKGPLEVIGNVGKHTRLIVALDVLRL
jgi:choline dehydrogenase-like flavoprotein